MNKYQKVRIETEYEDGDTYFLSKKEKIKFLSSYLKIPEKSIKPTQDSDIFIVKTTLFTSVVKDEYMVVESWITMKGKDVKLLHTGTNYKIYKIKESK